MNVVVGSINYDFTIYIRDFPEVGQTVTDGRFSTSPGGKGFNQAIACSRAGTKTKFIGCIGGDIIGKILSDVLKKEKSINRNFIPAVSVLKNQQSGCAFILVREDGKNKIVVSPGANRKISKKNVYNEMKKDDFEFILLQCEIEKDILEMCIDFAKKRKRKVILNSAPFRPWVKDIYVFVDFLVMNETEAKELARALSIDAKDLAGIAKALVSENRKIIITLGEEGVIFCDSENCFHLDAFEVKSVDAVGAGDAFCGYFASCLEKGKDIKEAIIFASAAGALTTTKKGAFTSIPNYNQVKKFLKDKKVELRHI